MSGTIGAHSGAVTLAVMIIAVASRQRCRYPAASRPGGVRRWILIVAVLAGLAAMHALGMHTLISTSTSSRASAAGALAAGDSRSPLDPVAMPDPAGDPCPDGGHDGPCPGHGHDGQVCQSGALSSAGTAVPQLVSWPGSAPAGQPPAALPVTAWAHAGAGSGCGPPSLTQLSISRT
jgi:hypothetical protein